MPPESDPFEEFRQKKLAEQKTKKTEHSPRGELAGEVEPDTARLLKAAQGKGEAFADDKPKGFESHRYGKVPKGKYDKPKGFETHTFKPKKSTE